MNDKPANPRTTTACRECGVPNGWHNGGCRTGKEIIDLMTLARDRRTEASRLRRIADATDMEAERITERALRIAGAKGVVNA